MQERAEQDKVKSRQSPAFEECKSKEERRRLLNKWKAEEIARKQKERERAFEQYMEERPDQYPLFRQKPFLLTDFRYNRHAGKKEREQMFNQYEEEEEARRQKEREKALDQYREEQPNQYPKSYFFDKLPTERNQEEEEEAENKFREEIKNHKKKVDKKAIIN